MDHRDQDVSRFLSYVLRHQPQAIGLTLDHEGWAEIDALIAAAATRGHPLDRTLIGAVVAGDDKQRFAVSDDGRRIRAAQGHSVDEVAILRDPARPPSRLYHGTAARFVEAILREGLHRGRRHHVHLSADAATAAAVGARHGLALVLRVDALAMYEHAFEFYRADNGVWLTAKVPPAFLGIAAA